MKKKNILKKLLSLTLVSAMFCTSVVFADELAVEIEENQEYLYLENEENTHDDDYDDDYVTDNTELESVPLDNVDTIDEYTEDETDASFEAADGQGTSVGELIRTAAQNEWDKRKGSPVQKGGNFANILLSQKTYAASGYPYGNTNWCALFVSQCLRNAGVVSSNYNNASAGMGKQLVDAGLATYVNSPMPGDIVEYTSGSTYMHVAVVDGIVNGKVMSFQGNLAYGSSSSGTYWAYCDVREYNRNSCQIKYVRLNNASNPTPTDHNPKVSLDKATSESPGTVTVGGWAFDPDDKNDQLTVHVYAYKGETPYLLKAIIANGERSDVNNSYGCGKYHGFTAILPAPISDTMEIRVAALNVGAGETTWSNSKTVTVSKDTTKPKVKNAVVSEISSSGYTVICDVSDNAGVKEVKFPTWSDDNGQDDLIWHVGTISNGKATCRIKTSDHGKQIGCNYTTDIYAYDYMDNCSDFARVHACPADRISDATVSEVKDQIYTSKEIKPLPTVKYGSKTLVKDTDYELSYKNNVEIGTATITISGKGAYAGSKTVNFKIVPVAVTNIKLDQSEASINIGSTLTFKATVEPDNATNKNVTWKSDNTGIAAVSPEGVVTGVSEGTTNITVTTEDGNKTATCKVTVKSNKTPTPVPTKTPTPVPTKTPTPVPTKTPTPVPTKTPTPIPTATPVPNPQPSPEPGKISILGAVVTYSGQELVYNGRVQRPTIYYVKLDGKTLKDGIDYSISWKNANSTNAGTYRIYITGKGKYTDSGWIAYKIKKASNSLSAKAKTLKVKASDVKKKAKTYKRSKAISISDKGQGKITYTKTKGNKKILINKNTGKVTIKKGLKKGKYSVQVSVVAAGDNNHKKKTKKMTVKVVVK